MSSYCAWFGFAWLENYNNSVYYSNAKDSNFLNFKILSIWNCKPKPVKAFEVFRI